VSAQLCSLTDVMMVSNQLELHQIRGGHPSSSLTKPSSTSAATTPATGLDTDLVSPQKRMRDTALDLLATLDCHLNPKQVVVMINVFRDDTAVSDYVQITWRFPLQCAQRGLRSNYPVLRPQTHQMLASHL
jgi:hypothetical protein